eukprot:355302-Chlamydomonas_euryale.AAC.12
MLDRERMVVAEERHALSQQRIDASHAADNAREAQLKLMEAVRQYVMQVGKMGDHMHVGAGHLQGQGLWCWHGQAAVR